MHILRIDAEAEAEMTSSESIVTGDVDDERISNAGRQSWELYFKNNMICLLFGLLFYWVY